MSPPSRRKEDKAKRAGMMERETGRWRDGDEGGACSACLDVNNAPEGSAANCQLLIFVVSFNHLRLCTPPLHAHTHTSLSSTWHPHPTPPHPTPLAMQRSAWIFYISASLHALRLHSVRLILRPSEFASFAHFSFSLARLRATAARKSADGYHGNRV